MARTAPRPRPVREQVLETVHAHCPACGGRLRYRYDNRHTVTTLAGLVRLRLRIRRCENPGCARYHRPYRPEAEGRSCCRSTSSASTSSPWSGRCAVASTRACRRSTAACASAGWRSPSVRSPTCWIATTSWWRPPGRRRPAAGGPGRAGARDPGARRPPAGRRARGPVGRARVPVGRGPARQEPAVLDGRGLGRAAARGRREGRRADRRGGQRRPALGPAGGAAGAARGAAPAVPVPLPARGGAADLRGRPPRQEGAEEAGPWCPPDRALGRGARRPRGRGGARLLRRGPLRNHRRRPAAAWRPRGCGSRTGSRRWRPASTGPPEKGAEPPAAAAAPVARPGARATPGHVATDPSRLRLGPPGGPILGNAAGEPAGAVRRRLDGLLAAMARHRAKAGPLAGAVDHFLEVTRSYRPGLFHGYAVADLPRTNNALEQLFGSYRRHQRRATGRKANSSATVLRGPVRLAPVSSPGCAAGTPAIWPVSIAALARGAREPRAPSARPGAAGAVPPRSRRLPQPARTAPPPASFAVLEKNKLWVWRAFDPVARRTLAWELGGRETRPVATSRQGRRRGHVFLTDDWEGFRRLIPEDRRSPART